MEKKELNLRDLIVELIIIWKFLLSKWKLISLTVLLTSALGLCVSIFTKSNYIASLKFVLDEEKKGGGGLSSIASSFGFGGLVSDNSLFSSPNMIEFLKTRSMVEETLLKPVREKKFEKFTYAELYLKGEGLREKWSDHPRLKKISFKINEQRSSFSREKDSILGVIYSRFLENGLTVTQPNEDNSIIQLTVTSKNEIFSKNFPIELMDVASLYYSDSKTKKAKLSVDILQIQVDSVKRELYTSLGSAASASDEVFGLNPAMNVQRVPSAKQQIQVKVNSAILEELVKNLEISKMNLLNETPIINIIDQPIYPLFEERIRKIKGILVGGIIGGFLMVLYLIVRRFFKNLNLKDQ